MGITIREIVEEHRRRRARTAGGFKAVQLGGPSGGCLPARLGDTPVDYDALRRSRRHHGLGRPRGPRRPRLHGRHRPLLPPLHAGRVVRQVHLLPDRHASACSRSSTGSARARGATDDLANLEELADRVSRTSLCGLGQTAPNPVLTTLRYFREEYEAHLRDRRCPAGRCAALIRLPRSTTTASAAPCAPRPARWGPSRYRPHERHAVDDSRPARAATCASRPARTRRSRWCRPARSARSRPGRRRGRPEVATVTLTIDGRTVDGRRGHAPSSRRRGALGIEIPTLCHVEGLEPVSSCFVCCVQVEGTRTLSPSCALPVADGMVVTTASDDIRAARRTALELLLSDHAGECVAPCAARCPAGLDIPGFVYEIASGENGRAIARIHERLSLPGALGRVCPRLCEESCRRCDWDHEGLAIGALHRYAADRNLEAASPSLPRPGRPTGKSVAIVGAGPAGLTAAFYLLQQGHACTLFDAHPLPGGMLRYGIPEYRLPRDALDAEIRRHRAARGRVPHGPALGSRLLPRRPATRARRRLPRDRRAALVPAALRGGGAGPLRDRLPAGGRRGRPAGPRAARGGDRRREHRDGLRAHRAPARARRSGSSTGGRGARCRA